MPTHLKSNLQTAYPDYSIIGIRQLCVEKEDGTRVLYDAGIFPGRDAFTVLKENGVDAAGRKIIFANLILEDADGLRRYPDFTPSELESGDFDFEGHHTK